MVLVLTRLTKVLKSTHQMMKLGINCDNLIGGSLFAKEMTYL
jgi:hypothetical protein